MPRDYIEEIKNRLRKQSEYDKNVALDIQMRKRIIAAGYADISDKLPKDKAIAAAKGTVIFRLKNYLPHDYTILEKKSFTEVYENDNLVCTYTELWYL